MEENKSIEDLPKHMQLFKNQEIMTPEKELEKETRLKIQKVTEECDVAIKINKQTLLADCFYYIVLDILAQLMVAPGIVALLEHNSSIINALVMLLLMIGEKLLLGKALYMTIKQEVLDNNRSLQIRDADIEILEDRLKEESKNLKRNK